MEHEVDSQDLQGYSQPEMPPSVRKTISFMEDQNLWYLLSRNPPAYSCKDAASKRLRLGYRGISLYDELKSYFAAFQNKLGQKQAVMIHCRGNQLIDMGKVKRILKTESPIHRLTQKELNAIFSSDDPDRKSYGMVNPFGIGPWGADSPLMQIFDKSLLEGKSPEGTMMTNAGDLTWGIEFDPKELIDRINFKEVGDISITDFSHPQANDSFLAIICGDGPEVGIAALSKIKNELRKQLGRNFRGDTSFPRFHFESLPEIGLSINLNLRKDRIWDALRNSLDQISNFEQKPSHLCIPSNNLQLFNSQIKSYCDKRGIEYVSLAGETGKYLQKEQILDFGFIGHMDVIESFDTKDWNISSDLSPVFPPEKILREALRISLDVKVSGINRSSQNRFSSLIRHSFKEQNIVIAINEFSLLMQSLKGKQKSDKNYIDTLDVLARAVASKLINH